MQCFHSTSIIDLLHVSFKIYDKRDGFNFEIGTFPFLDGYVSRSLFVSREYVLMMVTSTTESCLIRVCSVCKSFKRRLYEVKG